MLKAYRRTQMIPTCVVVIATARVEPGVSGSSAPSTPMTSFSVIAFGGMGSPLPVSVVL
jgi:hypothetical protein